MKKLVIFYFSAFVLFVNVLQANNSFFIENQFKITNYQVESGDSVTLKGKVTDKATGKALRGAEVFLFRKDSLLQSTSTDFEGNYVIEVMEGVNYKIKVKYVDNEKSVKEDEYFFQCSDNGLAISSGTDPSTEKIKNLLFCAMFFSKYKNPFTTQKIEKLNARKTIKDSCVSIKIILIMRNYRTGNTNYYVDGVRVSGRGLLPAKPTLRQKIKKSFKQIRERLKL